MLWRAKLERYVEQLHRDYLDILAKKFRAEVMIVTADAFIDRHLDTGLTIEDMATRLNTSADAIRRMFDMNDPATKRGLGLLSDMCAALGCRPVVTIRDIGSPPEITTDRETRTGDHLLQVAKSLGWPDDGEGALEFVMRRTREVALEDAAATTALREIASIGAQITDPDNVYGVQMTNLAIAALARPPGSQNT
jgi:hypothetical protein